MLNTKVFNIRRNNLFIPFHSNISSQPMTYDRNDSTSANLDIRYIMKEQNLFHVSRKVAHVLSSPFHCMLHVVEQKVIVCYVSVCHLQLTDPRMIYLSVLSLIACLCFISG